MFEVFLLLIVCSSLAWLYERSCIYYENDIQGQIVTDRRATSSSNVLFFSLLAILIIFSGTRTVMNDTAVYLIKYSEVPNSLSAISRLDYSLGANPLFEIYRIIVKTLISNSGNVFLFVTAILVLSSYLLFIKRYAFDFGYSIFILLGFTVYAFTMAAIKQTMATAIAIWAVPLILRGKRLKPFILILIAMMIHPYVVVYYSAFLLGTEVWGKKSTLLIAVTLVAGTLFSEFVPALLRISSSIGDEYDVTWFEGNAVSVMRLIVYIIVPLLSFVARRRIRENADDFTIMAINLSIVSSCFVILASFGGANMFGRLANYLDVFQCLALPPVLFYGYGNSGIKRFLVAGSVAGYALFYYTYYTKYISMGTCFYNHISIFELLRNW